MNKEIEFYFTTEIANDCKIIATVWCGEKGERGDYGVQMTPDYGPEVKSLEAFDDNGNPMDLSKEDYARAENYALVEFDESF